MKRVLIIMLCSILLLVSLYLFGSGVIAQRAVKAWLTTHHIAVNDISIDYANLRSISIATLALGTENNFTLRDADISYQMIGKKPILKEAQIGSATLTFTRAQDAYDIGGLETLLPMTSMQEEAVADSTRITLGGAVSITHNDGVYKAHFSQASIMLTHASLVLKAEQIDALVTYHETTQNIEFSLTGEKVMLENDTAPLTTPLVVNISGAWNGQQLDAQGKISDRASLLPLIMTAKYSSKTKRTTLQWNSPKVTFEEGGLQPAIWSPLLSKIPPVSGAMHMEGSAKLEDKFPITLSHIFYVENAELSPLLKTIFKDDIAMTGQLSGTIPLRWKGRDAPQIVGAHLSNVQPGKLSYDPLNADTEAFSSNPQSNLVLDVLKGFHYTTLTLDADSDAVGNLTATLRLMGANPDFYQGKAVDFNLNLKGNVLAILSSESTVQKEITHQ